MKFTDLLIDCCALDISRAIELSTDENVKRHLNKAIERLNQHNQYIEALEVRNNLNEKEKLLDRELKNQYLSNGLNSIMEIIK